MNLKTQFELLVYSFLIGIYLGVTYDLVYYFILMHIKKLLKAIIDIFFFVCQGFIIFNVIYKINNGIIPIYCYLLIGFGFSIYYSYSKQYYHNNIKPLKELVNKVYTKLTHLLKYIFIKPFFDTYYFFAGIIIFIIKKIRGCVNRVKKRIKKYKKKLKQNEIKT